MRSKFRIEDFEPINMEKAQKILDKRIENARKSLDTLRAKKEIELEKISAWKSLTEWLKNIFGLHR